MSDSADGAAAGTAAPTTGSRGAESRGAGSPSSSGSATLPPLGRTEDGVISISPGAVKRLVGYAAVQERDAGSTSARQVGRLGFGAGRVGGPPKTTVLVDGGKVFVTLELGVRWPASVADVTDAVRSNVRRTLAELTGLSVDEVDITVTRLITDVEPAARVQ